MYIEAVGVLVQRKDSKVLLLHRRPEVREGNKFGLAGGVVRPEKGVIGTAIFKAKTEAGINLIEDNLILIGEFAFSIDGHEVKYFAYTTKINTDEIHVEVDEDDHMGFKWLYPKEAVLRSDLMVGMYPILKKFNSDS